MARQLLATAASVPVALIAILHVYIMTLEMFLWTTPRGRRSFKLTPEFAAQTATLAANQGLYNGFLAAGLVWGLLHPVAEFATQIQLFFLACVAVAGVYGGATVNRRVFFIQTVPAMGAVAVIWLLR